jgi:hypothetical protein
LVFTSEKVSKEKRRGVQRMNDVGADGAGDGKRLYYLVNLDLKLLRIVRAKMPRHAARHAISFGLDECAVGCDSKYVFYHVPCAKRSAEITRVLTPLLGNDVTQRVVLAFLPRVHSNQKQVKTRTSP